MKLRKILAVLFAFILAFSITGCGKSKESKGTDANTVTSGASDITDAGTSTNDKGAWTYSALN